MDPVELNWWPTFQFYQAADTSINAAMLQGLVVRLKLDL